MKLLLAAALAAVGLVALSVWLERRRRRQDAEEATYVPQLRAWYAQEPHLRPLPLPRVRPLQARRVTASERVRRFSRRA